MLFVILASFVILLNSFGSDASKLSTSLKVYGGASIDITEAPFTAILKFEEIRCGASIISHKHALTLARCARNLSKKDTLLFYGSTKLSTASNVSLENIFIHPKFRGRDYDVAIVEVNRPFCFNAKVKAIEVGEQVPPDDSQVTIAGFGYTSMDAFDFSDTLEKVSLPMVTRIKCKYAYRRTMTLTDRMICAGDKEHSPCFGDEGNGIVENGKLVGISSLIVECGSPRYPPVFTSITYPAIREFIRKITKE